MKWEKIDAYLAQAFSDYDHHPLRAYDISVRISLNCRDQNHISVGETYYYLAKGKNSSVFWVTKTKEEIAELTMNPNVEYVSLGRIKELADAELVQ